MVKRKQKNVQLVDNVTRVVTTAAAVFGHGSWPYFLQYLVSLVFTDSSCKMFLFLFSTGGVIVGAVVQRNGFLAELGIQLPGQNYYYEDYGNYIQERYTNMYF